MKEVTIRVDEDHANGSYRVTTLVDARLLEVYKVPLIDAIIQDATKRLVDQFLEEHASALLEQLSPGLLAKRVADALAKKVLG